MVVRFGGGDFDSLGEVVDSIVIDHVLPLLFLVILSLDKEFDEVLDERNHADRS